LATLQLGSQRVLGHAEVRRSGIETAEETEVPEPESGATKERRRTGLDARLDRIAFGLRESSRRDRGVYAVLQRLLQRVAQCARCDVKPISGVIDQRLTLVAR